MLKIRERTAAHTSKKSVSVIGCIITAAAAFLASMGKIMGYPSPVNVAVAVVSGKYIIPAFLGSALSYIVSGNAENGIIQLCTILVIAGIRLTVMHDSRRDDPVFLGLLTSGIMILFSCVMSVAVPSDAYTASLRMITALIGGCLVFIAKTVKQNYECEGVFELGGLNGVFAAILYIMTVATLAAVPLPYFNAGRIFGAFALLAAVRKYKTAGGAVVGALTTCGILLCSPQLAGNTLLLATSGLICGAFVQFGVLAAAFVFIGVSLISLVAIGINSDTFFMFADLLAGSVLFIACPVSFLKKTAARFFGVRSSVDLVGQTASSRLNFASRTLGDIRGQIALVSAAIDKKTENADLKVRVCTSVCGNCELFGMCWKKSRNAAKQAFERLEQTVMKYNGISVLDVEKQLPLCCRTEALTDGFNEIYKNLLAEKADNIRVKELRGILTEQLSSMEDMLSDLSYRVGQVRAVDPSLSAQVRDHFAQLGYPNAKACVYIDENSTQRAEVFLTAGFKGDLVKLTTGISAIAETDFDIPVITQVDNVTKLSFNELPAFEIQMGTFQASSGDNEYSGDTLDTLELTACEKYIILSDGMGTGKRARLDSMFAVNLARRLLKAGFSMTTAHRLINSILRVKGWEESFATLDLLRLDLCGGSAEFLKSGAAPAYLYRDGAFRVIGGQAFPAGILEDCPPDTENLKLFKGDIIIMTSDGVSESTVRRLPSVIKRKASSSAEIAQKLGEYAMNVKNGGKRDDISIAVISIDGRK